ncbi:pyruvyl transferase 1-like [Haliotis rufescens]|uniref:pyruvyl transferase 1-like n=1 Tax=Haliotis rufescens TaxID=6454 RepID=UPI00201F2CAF|nr:pyruvyl transferase 1-like [Haliotis rufescens]
MAGSSFIGPGFHKPVYLTSEIVYESLDVTTNDKFRQFLDTNLSKTPALTDVISPNLRSSYDVIAEAQRIHFNVFSELLAPFKYAILIDIAAFANKGDPAITVGEVYLLRRLGIKLLYYCNYNACKSRNLNYIRNVARNFSDSEVVVLLQGGGNVVGYKFHDYLRQRIFNTFSQYKIILFPQTVFMREGLSKHVTFCEKLYRQTDFIMMLRDRQSFSLAQKHFSGKPTFFLMPDIAFQIGAISRFISPMFDIMWLKRVDPEAPRQNVTKWPKGVTVQVEAWVNWETPKGKTTIEDSFLMQTNGMIFLQRGRVVITDRLHGHIFCVLMNIPHVLIDTPYRKLSSYHETWTRDLENTVLAVDADDALVKAVSLLDKYKDSLPSIVSFMDIEENPVL